MEPNWVIVKDKTVLEYESFTEAASVNALLGGHLMSKSYFENHYKKEHVTKFSDISDNRS
jgi:hypothetical protein